MKINSMLALRICRFYSELYSQGLVKKLLLRDLLGGKVSINRYVFVVSKLTYIEITCTNRLFLLS